MNKLTLAMIPVMGLSMFAVPAGMAVAAEPGEHMVQRQENFFERQAEILGLSLTEVKTAWAEGTKIMDLAEQHGISKDELKEKVRTWAHARRDERLQALVAGGVITQAQADERKETLEERAEDGKGKRHPLRRFFHGRK